jgi:ketosteroid isomerase-like protein
MMSDGPSTSAELVQLTQKLLESIAAGDWATYAALCDPTLSAFEPECLGHLVEGLAFHRFYFDLGASQEPRTTTIASPHVRVLGDVGIVSYVRLTQKVDELGTPIVTQCQETRVWHKGPDGWKHVHFHRSVGE